MGSDHVSGRLYARVAALLAIFFGVLLSGKSSLLGDVVVCIAVAAELGRVRPSLLPFPIACVGTLCAQLLLSANWGMSQDMETASLRGLQLRTISVVMPAHNEHAYLARTIRSLYERTPSTVLREIIVVDDASTPPLAGILEQFPEVKCLRHDVRRGLVKSKVDGGNLATADVLMFFDAHVKPAELWYRPMLVHVNRNHRRVVVPMVTGLDESWADTSDDFADSAGKMMFDWTLQSRWFEDGTDLVPCMSGGIFAISKRWWHESGEYDYAMGAWGAENVEMSIRIWLCGGEIYVARDSSIGHLFRDRFPYTLNNTEVYLNKVRTVETWFDEYKSRYYQHSPESWQFLPFIGNISDRLALREKLHCKGFPWLVKKFKHVFFGQGLIDEQELLQLSKSRDE